MSPSFQRAVFVASLLAGAAVAALLLPRRDPTVDVRFREVAPARATTAPVLLERHPRWAGSRETAQTSSSARNLQVVDADGAAVASASVVFPADSRDDETLVASTTYECDQWGRCRLPEGLEGLCAASAPGLSPTLRFVPATGDVRIQLEAPEYVTGVVVTPEGMAASGARVAASLALSSPEDLQRGDGGRDGVTRYIATADARGAFVLTVPRGVDLVVGAADPAYLVHHESFEQRTVVRAGAKGVRLVIRPLAVVAVRLIDEATGRVVSRAPRDIFVEDPLAHLFRNLTYLERSDLTRLFSRGQVDGVLSTPGLLVRRVERRAEELGTVELKIFVPGYAPTVSRVPPQPWAAGVEFFDVPLKRETGAGEVADLRAHLQRPRLRMESNGPAVLLVKRDGLTRVTGEMVDEAQWLFRDVPAGKQEAILEWGGLMSAFEYDAPAGLETECRIEFPPVTGVFLTVRDASGRRISDFRLSARHAESVVEHQEIRYVWGAVETKSVVHPPASVFPLPDRGGRGEDGSIFYALRPGEQTLIIERIGFLPTKASLDARRGSAAVLEVRLTPAE